MISLRTTTEKQSHCFSAVFVLAKRRGDSAAKELFRRFEFHGLPNSLEGQMIASQAGFGTAQRHDAVAAKERVLSIRYIVENDRREAELQSLCFFTK